MPEIPQISEIPKIDEKTVTLKKEIEPKKEISSSKFYVESTSSMDRPLVARTAWVDKDFDIYTFDDTDIEPIRISSK